MNKKVIQEFVAKKADTDIRLDIFIADKMGVTRSNAQKLIKSESILVNGQPVSSKYALVTKDKVTQIEAKQAKTPNIPIIFEDTDILIIDKPAGITVHPAPGESSVTVAEVFAGKYTGSKPTDREMIVHRLDKGTSGVMILAKNDKARESLVAQFAARKVAKKYLALATGRVTPSEGVIDMPLARDLMSRNRVAPADEGKDAKTLYKAIKYYRGYTLINANPKTGRTHQIRVHFAAIGHPLYGDVRYGAKDVGATRIFLHAAELSFLHPTTGMRVKFVSETPAELLNILSKLEVE